MRYCVRDYMQVGNNVHTHFTKHLIYASTREKAMAEARVCIEETLSILEGQSVVKIQDLQDDVPFTIWQVCVGKFNFYVSVYETE